MIKDYKHKETWSRQGKDFLIEVVRWETMTEEQYKDAYAKGYSFNGRFVWNVYCHLIKLQS